MDPSLDAVLPPGVVREAGAPPPPPADYGDGYVLPVHSEKPLQAAARTATISNSDPPRENICHFACSYTMSPARLHQTSEKPCCCVSSDAMH